MNLLEEQIIAIAAKSAPNIFALLYPTKTKETNMNKVQSEDPISYAAASAYSGRRPVVSGQDDDEIIYKALTILEARMRKPMEDTPFSSPDDAKKYVRLRLRPHPSEVFAVLFLDNRHRLITYEEMFRGTIDGASVHPREVVRAAINCNAAAVIFAHNHPSGIAIASQSDIKITKRLKDALALIDVRVLDHLIVGDNETTSLAEAGQWQ